MISLINLSFLNWMFICVCVFQPWSQQVHWEIYQRVVFIGGINTHNMVIKTLDCSAHLNIGW